MWNRHLYHHCKALCLYSHTQLILNAFCPILWSILIWLHLSGIVSNVKMLKWCGFIWGCNALQWVFFCFSWYFCPRGRLASREFTSHTHEVSKNINMKEEVRQIAKIKLMYSNSTVIHPTVKCIILTFQMTFAFINAQPQTQLFIFFYSS